MQEVGGQTQRRYICHESDVIIGVCNNIRQLLEHRTCLTRNTGTSSICHLQQISPNTALPSFVKSLDNLVIQVVVFLVMTPCSDVV